MMIGMEVEEEAATVMRVDVEEKESNDDFDFCNSLLSRFRDSNHQTLCAVIMAMSEKLREQNLPTSPVSYFYATLCSVDQIISEHNPSNDLIHALLIILFLLLARVPRAVLKNKRDHLSNLLLRVLASPSVSDTALAYGLKCISHLGFLINSQGHTDNLLSVLLAFLTDSRPKVRRQSHLSLRDVLLNIRNSSLLASASEGITKQFVDSILRNASEGTKGAQQVLYLLHALRECLPLLCLKSKTSILKCFKTLLELDQGQPLVASRIRDALNFLCLHPTSEISPEPLVELFRSLTLSISSSKISTDEMSSTARLLDTGMNKLYSLNRKTCVNNLPFVFNSLKDILASGHEEASFAATDALKSIINACIDESLIKKGVVQIALDESMISGPTIIEKICTSIECLLHYHYAAVWDRVFQVVSAMFHKLGTSSPYYMRGILNNLKDVQKLPDEEFPFRKQHHVCIGSALVAMGPETFLSLIPLNLEADDLSEANVWLFPILKQYIVGARLSYFTEEILPMIERVREKAQKLEKQGLVVSSRNADALAYSLWSLLPSFCNYPVGTAKSFMDLQKHLCNKLEEEPGFRGIICTGLQLLIQQTNNIMDSDNKDYIGKNTFNERVLVQNSQQVSPAKDLLKDLSEVFLKSTNDDGGCLQRTIGHIASITDKADVQNLFKEKMQKLVKCTLKAEELLQSSNKVDYFKNFMQIGDASNNVFPSVFKCWSQLLDFEVLLLPGLDDEDIALLFQAIKPVLQGLEGVKMKACKVLNGFMQKKAYKVLSIILKSSDNFVSLMLKELLGFMRIHSSCHSYAYHHRLDCLRCLIILVFKSQDNLEHWPEVDSFLPEIILDLTKANKDTRNTAYDILVEIAHAYGDKDRDGNREKLNNLFSKLVAFCLNGKTPHMKSAAAKGLACLAYKFSDLALTALNQFPFIFCHLPENNREIVKATLGLLKVLVVKSQAEGLQMHLRSMVKGLLRLQDNTANCFKAKVKLLLGMLVTKCGLEAVKAVMPKKHKKLLSSICKMKRRKERNRVAKSEETRSHLSKATTSWQSMWNHTEKNLDFDGDNDSSDTEYINAIARTTCRGEKTSSHLKSAASLFLWSNIRLEKNLREHSSDKFGDEPLDLLDRQETRSGRKRDSSRLDDEGEVDSEGRLIIREEDEQKKKNPAKPNFDIKSVPDSHSHLSARCGSTAEKRRKTSYSGWAYTGREYASKKAASGDVKRKGKLEPYAYWPLDQKIVSRHRHHRASARKGMASVVKMTRTSLKGRV